MLLAIDVGNTNTVFALFEIDAAAARYTLLGEWRSVTVAQRTADEYAVFLDTLMRDRGIVRSGVDDVIIGSVVPEANFNLQRLCRDYFNCTPRMVGAPDVETGLKVRLDRPDEIGADRIINAVAGIKQYGAPLLIIDFGTATTFDVVNAEGHYVGGAIAPGINLSLQALHMAAAKLPRIGIAPTAKVIASNTTDAIRSGVYWGYAGLIEGMINRIRAEIGKPMTVVATGGLAPLFIDVVKGIDHVNDQLTLLGLAEIHRRTTRATGT